MKNQSLDPARKAQMTKLVNEFIRELRKTKTIEGLGSSLTKLTGFKLDNEVESNWMARRLKSRVQLLVNSEESEDRQAVYGLVLCTIQFAMLIEDVHCKVDKFREDINDITMKHVF